MDVADNIAVLNEGRIEQIGTPLELYEQPANDFVMSFLGPVARLRGPARAPARPARHARARRRRRARHGRARRAPRLRGPRGARRRRPRARVRPDHARGGAAARAADGRARVPPHGRAAAALARRRRRGLSQTRQGRRAPSRRARPRLDLPRRGRRAVVGGRPRGDGPRARPRGARRRAPARPPAGPPAGESRRRGQADAEPGPVGARGVLRHVARRRAAPPRRSPSTAPARACRARRGDTTTSHARHRLRVRQPRHQPRVGRRGERPRVAPVRARQHPHRRVRQARERGAQQRAPRGPARSRARAGRPGRRRGGGSAALARRLPQQRADDPQPGRPAARVLEVRQRAHQRERARQRGVAVGERAEPEPRARLVVLAPPELEPVRHGRVERPPGPARRARVRGRRAPIENGGAPGGGQGCTWGTSVATGTPHSSAASAGAAVRMSATATSGAEGLDGRDRLARGADRRRVGRHRPLAGGEDLVLRARRGTSSRPPRPARASAARSAARRCARARRGARPARASGRRGPGRRTRRGRPAAAARAAPPAPAAGASRRRHSPLTYATIGSERSSSHWRRPSWIQPSAS